MAFVMLLYLGYVRRGRPIVLVELFCHGAECDALEAGTVWCRSQVRAGSLKSSHHQGSNKALLLQPAACKPAFVAPSSAGQAASSTAAEVDLAEGTDLQHSRQRERALQEKPTRRRCLLFCRQGYVAASSQTGRGVQASRAEDGDTGRSRCEAVYLVVVCFHRAGGRVFPEQVSCTHAPSLHDGVRV